MPEISRFFGIIIAMFAKTIPLLIFMQNTEIIQHILVLRPEN